MMLTRKMLFYLDDDAPGTFAKDEDAKALPLPTLNETMERYYESLRPFGTSDELKNSRKIIDDFKNGIGKKLQKIVEERAKTNKNWVERWWEDYVYCADRTPIYPFGTMASALRMHSIGVPETKEYGLKGMSKMLQYSFEYWDLIRREKLAPTTNPSGSITFSSFLLKRLFNTSRIVGEPMDKITTWFKTISDQGNCDSHFVVLAKGRVFSFDVFNQQGQLLDSTEIYSILQQIRNTVDERDVENPIPILTCDTRTDWAKNRKYLMELSTRNAEIVNKIDRAIALLSMDENEPANYCETSYFNLAGDSHSRWSDKSCTFITFRNGKQACIGDHGCYDGTISMAFSFFVFLGILEETEEPNWNRPRYVQAPIELIFDIDDYLVDEIKRVTEFVSTIKSTVILTNGAVDFGKTFLKTYRLHPDAFVQMIIQLAYYKLHNEFVATYETALMRDYYNGRTETLRSCTLTAVDFVKTYLNENESDQNKLKALTIAVNSHNDLMEAARSGKGIDCHLFGLWCAAYEADLPIPELYDDELYKRSGGGGNFILSTSLLGYSLLNGYVAPMCPDGYALFYSVIGDTIFLNVSVFRDSEKTSSTKFFNTFNELMHDVKGLVERTTTAKL